MRAVTEAAARDPEQEEDFLRLHRNGDPEAFAHLVAEYRGPVYSYLVRCGVPPDDRDDVFQEIFIRLHSAAAHFEADRPLQPWLFTIVANRVRTYQRKRRIREIVFASSSAAGEPEAPDPREDYISDARRTLAWLESEIPRLPPAQREVLVLACIERLPHRQIAMTLDLPVNTVKTHLRRARLALTQRLARHNAARRSEGGR